MTPDTHTISEFMLPVGDGHELYVHDWGNPKAKLPIIALHGGPGGGSSDKHKLRFDPSRQRVIFYDQRGAGRSTPFGELRANTTDHLVADIEAIAEKLGIDQWIVTGNSWGSTLALVYAIRHPKRVKQLVISGIFTATPQEIAYVDHGLYRTHFPDVWEEYLQTVPEDKKSNPFLYHIARIFGKDQTAALASMAAVSDVNSKICKLDDRFLPSPLDEEGFTSLRTELYYLDKKCFFTENYIQEHAKDLKMPVWIVQGRYDFICPPITAWDLHGKLPKSQFFWAEAGHSGDRSVHDITKGILASLT